MNYGTLYRHHEAPDGIWGILLCNGFECFTLELPWKNNRRNESCILLGSYVAEWCMSHTFGRELYLLRYVPNRTGIRIHAGNTIDDLNGCIALGRYLWRGGGSWALADSRNTVERLASHWQREPWVVNITWERPWRFDGSHWIPAASPTMEHRLEEHAEAHGVSRPLWDQIKILSRSPI